MMIASITIRELVAARIGYLASLPNITNPDEIDGIKKHALFLGMSEAEFEEFLPLLLQSILQNDTKFLEHLKKGNT